MSQAKGSGKKAIMKIRRPAEDKCRVSTMAPGKRFSAVKDE